MEQAPQPVALEPLWRSAGLLRVMVPWLLVVVVGRRVCLVAQKSPLLVWVVRAIAARLEWRRSLRAGGPRSPVPTS